MFMVNTCDAMGEAFNSCPVGCETSLGSEQPAYVIESADPTQHKPGMCLITSDPEQSKCRASHPSTIRLCPCQ